MLANISRSMFGRFSRTVLPGTSSKLNISTNAAYLAPEQQPQQQQSNAGTAIPASTINSIHALNADETEAARHFEKAMAQDAADAATFGNIRVLPAASPKYHRVCEMHAD